MKFNKVVKNINEQVIAQADMAPFYAKIESPEKTYTKRTLTFDVEVAQNSKKIDTIIDGKTETTNTAKKGDYILTGSKGEKYVLSPQKFEQRYTMTSDGRAKTKPVQTKAKKYKGPTMKFMASWGEEMILESGDFIINNNGEYYRIEKEAFHNTYK